MSRLILAAIAALSLAVPSFADVTLKATGSGKSMGVSGNMTTTTYIKGCRQRWAVATP